MTTQKLNPKLYVDENGNIKLKKGYCGRCITMPKLRKLPNKEEWRCGKCGRTQFGVNRRKSVNPYVQAKRNAAKV